MNRRIVLYAVILVALAFAPEGPWTMPIAAVTYLGLFWPVIDGGSNRRGSKEPEEDE